MQGKALAAVVASLAAAVGIGCGGGGQAGDSTSTAEQGREPAVVLQARQEADRIRRERRREHEQGSPSQSPEGGASAGDDGSQAPPQLPVRHHDSGGGAAQFRHKGGDNSVQEFGEEGGSSERARAAAALHGYLDARVAHSWDVACSYLSAGLIASLERFGASVEQGGSLSCPALLAVLSKGSSDMALRAAADVDVGSLRTDGTRGFLLYHGAGHASYAIPMIMEDGFWKSAALEGSPVL